MRAQSAERDEGGSGSECAAQPAVVSAKVQQRELATPDADQRASEVAHHFIEETVAAHRQRPSVGVPRRMEFSLETPEIIQKRPKTFYVNKHIEPANSQAQL